MKKYLVIDEFNTPAQGDSDSYVYDTLDAANAAARSIWDHLTAQEQATRHVAVYAVTESDLSDYATEDGVTDWRLVDSYNSVDGAFDSVKAE